MTTNVIRVEEKEIESVNDNEYNILPAVPENTNTLTSETNAATEISEKENLQASNKQTSDAFKETVASTRVETYQDTRVRTDTEIVMFFSFLSFFILDNPVSYLSCSP